MAYTIRDAVNRASCKHLFPYLCLIRFQVKEKVNQTLLFTMYICYVFRFVRFTKNACLQSLLSAKIYVKPSN